MPKLNKRFVAVILVLGLAGFGFGVWVLLHPASIFVQPWRADRAETPVSGVLLGPYPVEEDFADLKKRGVTTIISLLEPNVPYEKVLLEQERELAKKYGMTVKNFPMGSILGQKFGDDYVQNSKAAAEAALAADGVAYIHCYLGVHRAKNVQRYLAEHAQVQAQTYSATNATSDRDLEAERRAKELFRAADYDGSLKLLATVTKKTARVLRVEGWNLYRLKRLDEARSTFQRALEMAPNDHDAQVGLAYTDLSAGRLDEAESAFSELRRLRPDDVSVLEGVGNVYYRQARWKDAEAVLAEALRRNPENQETRNMLQRVRQFATASAGASDA